MKRLALLLLLVCVGCAHTPTPVPVPVPPEPNPDHTITLTFTQNFADAPACSPTATASCLSGFNEGYVSGSNSVQLHNDTTTVCSGTTQPENCTTTFNGTVPIGSVTFYVATTYLDQTGTAGVAPNSLFPPVAVGADPATAGTVTVK